MDITPCTSKMSLLEQSICKYAEKPMKSLIKSELGLTFNSLGEAYDFYRSYLWEVWLWDQVW